MFPSEGTQILTYHDHPAGVMARRTAKRRSLGRHVDVGQRHWGSRLHGARGDGQRERQRDGVAEVNGRALGQSAQAVGRVRGWRESRLGPTTRRLLKDAKQSQRNPSEERTSASTQKQSRYPRTFSLCRSSCQRGMNQALPPACLQFPQLLLR